MTDITYAPEVLDAKKNGAPIVALESTIITHGMPWPRNYETALQVHEAVRANGATPATMAVLEGRLHVGLTEGALETLAQAK
ncbi:MAG: pseudouridine-5'-phosphate glycosidase, partial [Pseudomonadota bacterium]